MAKQVATYAATVAKAKLAPFTVELRAVGAHDVAIDVLFCGVCHSDVHQARGEWGDEIFPMVPGHEIVGRVASVGSAVTKFKVGDTVGVGCMVDSCRSCSACHDHLEQYCEKTFVGTYNAKGYDGVPTYGGYSKHVIVTEHFVLRVPDNLNLAAAAPLLCAGVTTWSPLRHWNVKAGDKVGVVGLGGLGHMAVKLAHALGAEVTVITTSAGKSDAAKALGAQHVIVSSNAEALKAAEKTLDFIIDTVSADHSLALTLLRRQGTLVIVGAPEHPLKLKVSNILFQRRNVAGSIIGGIAETQEMLDFCGKHNITADIEVIPIQQINEAYERMLKSDVRYRFVIDMASL